MYQKSLQKIKICFFVLLVMSAGCIAEFLKKIPYTFIICKLKNCPNVPVLQAGACYCIRATYPRPH